MRGSFCPVCFTWSLSRLPRRFLWKQLTVTGVDPGNSFPNLYRCLRGQQNLEWTEPPPCLPVLSLEIFHQHPVAWLKRVQSSFCWFRHGCLHVLVYLRESLREILTIHNHFTVTQFCGHDSPLWRLCPHYSRAPIQHLIRAEMCWRSGPHAYVH